MSDLHFLFTHEVMARAGAEHSQGAKVDKHWILIPCFTLLDNLRDPKFSGIHLTLSIIETG
jgi:hypothetical protein